jgi:cytochrome P450
VTGTASTPSADQLGALTFVEACAYETMRLRPAAPVLGLQAVRDAIIGDIHVPAGTLIWGVMRHDSVREQYFPNPGVFEPGRWLGEGGLHQASGSRRASSPFGGGPRVCPGRYLALQEIKLVVAMLLRHFEIASVRPPRGRKPRERLAFTMAPAGLRMELRVADPSSSPAFPHERPAGS